MRGELAAANRRHAKEKFNFVFIAHYAYGRHWKSSPYFCAFLIQTLSKGSQFGNKTYSSFKKEGEPSSFSLSSCPKTFPQDTSMSKKAASFSKKHSIHVSSP